MEKNLDRKTLNYSRGMTNVPSDLLSDDTELLECDGFIYRDGEMKPIQNLKLVRTIPYKLMYVHKDADYDNIITYDEKSTIYWYRRTGRKIGNVMGSFNVGTVYDIKSVGNTLVIATDNGLHYILFKGGTYKDLGTELPKPRLNPSFQRSQVGLGKTTACELKEIIESTSMKAVYNEDGSLKEIVDAETIIDLFLGYFQFKPINEYNKQTAFQDAVQGHAASVIARAKRDNYFLFPFFVRFALKLFDGSYVRISAPIACYPTINRNCYYVPVKYDNDSFVQSNEDVREFMMYPFYGRLYFSASIDGMDGWDDIVKELVVFASDDVMPFYLNEDWSFKRATEVDGEEYINFPNSSNAGVVTPPPGVPSLTVPDFKFHFNKDTYAARDVIMPKYKSDSEIIKELVSKSQFYKLFSVKATSKYVDGSTYEAPIDKYVVENITTQEQLVVDDYYGWSKMVSNALYPYNKRINLLGITRYPFEGFSKFGDSQSTYVNNSFSYYVHIVSGGMDAWVKSDEEAVSFPDYADAWFYYPDPNATEVIVWDENNGRGMKINLESHPMLNGSYSFNKLPTKDTFEANIYSRPTVDTSAHETLDSQIFTSAVNNPFVFEASGDNTVGTGKILGIVANTDAVSQGQFGQYPLFVFTTEGIYGMSVNSEGLYSATYPISREVCDEDSQLLPTDKLVYFVSEKGLMAATGGTVACMSEQMKGRVARSFVTLGDGKFKDFLKGCMIAYDYRDSMLRIFRKDKTYQYVYNMIDKTFSMVNSGVAAKAVVNDYPDNLIQATNGKVYSLIYKPEINDDSEVYNGSFVTRPLKLGGSVYLKSIRAIKHLTDSDNGKLSLEVYGSNDCKHWQKLDSLGGKPYKYFTFKYKLTGFNATDSFAGTIVEIQPRRNDKMR